MACPRREQLKRSTALRVRGQRALDELRAKFEAITKDLVGDAAATLTVPSLASPGGRTPRCPVPIICEQHPVPALAVSARMGPWVLLVHALNRGRSTCLPMPEDHAACEQGQDLP